MTVPEIARPLIRQDDLMRLNETIHPPLLNSADNKTFYIVLISTGKIF